MWWPLEDSCRNITTAAFHSKVLANFCGGMLAGAVMGVVLNPISAVRYQCWGEKNPNFATTAYNMWRKNGYLAFRKGTAPTVLRDVVFGGVFTGTRHSLHSTLGTENRRSTQGLPLTLVTMLCVSLIVSIFLRLCDRYGFCSRGNCVFGAYELLQAHVFKP